jgi:2-methylcitrate dehydratase PrpD
MELTAKINPQNGLEGKFSVFHACAAAMIHGAALEAQFSDAVVCEPVVVALRKKITAFPDAGIAKLEAKVIILLTDGRILQTHVAHALGSLQHPMSDADLAGKFSGLVDPVMPQSQAQSVIQMCWDFAQLNDSGQLSRATASV